MLVLHHAHRLGGPLIGHGVARRAYLATRAAGRKHLGAGVARRAPVAAVFVTTGVLHFTTPDTFTAIVPEALPAPEALVYASGVAEIAGGVGVLSRRTARWAGWWLILTLVAVFPANVDMALDAGRHPSIPPALLWARLPLQAVLIAWVHWAAIRRPSP